MQNIMGLTCLKGDVKPLNDDDASILTSVVHSSEYEAFLIDVYQAGNLGVPDVMSRAGSTEIWNMTLSDGSSLDQASTKEYNLTYQTR